LSTCSCTRAGVRHFRRAENDAGGTAVYVCELDPATTCYALAGIHHDRLVVSVPYDIDIDLTRVGRRGA